MRSLLSLFPLFAFASSSFGQFTDIDPEPAFPMSAQGFDFNFEMPNEVQPKLGIPIVEKAPEGAYVTVGTERGFLAASIPGKVSHLMLLDYNPNVVYFNRINIALLKIAKNRKDYVDLRLNSNRSAWLKRLKEAKNLTEMERQLLTFPETFNWWRRSVRSSSFNGLHLGPGKSKNFAELNYLYIDAQFKKIKSMADAGRIEAHQCDLTSQGARDYYIEALKRAKVPVSVFDASNAWWRRLGIVPYYMGPRRFSQVLADFMEAGTKDSIFLHTNTSINEVISYIKYLKALKKYRKAKTPRNKERLGRELAKQRAFVDWTYHGYTFGHIESFVRTLDFTSLILLGEKGGVISPSSTVVNQQARLCLKQRILARLSSLVQ